MKKHSFLIFILTVLFFSCGKDESPREHRFLDKVIITEAKLTGWDVLSNPDMMLSYRDGLVDSTSLSGQSEVIDEVVFLPVTFEDIPFELTDFMDFRVLDVDEFAADDIMFQRQINPYALSEKGNPFLLSSSDWKIKIYWKTY
ncbi:MAG TPA: hypothetical protein ENJ53_05865 [Phaeodactylibacter sp.]|nr:hypothetical protein [Phaeodactylibacter sp.]